MTIQIIKRDGRKQDYHKEKIEVAVNKSARSCSVRENIGSQIAENITLKLYESEVEEIDIQDIEELVFLELSKDYPLIARAYEGYRAVREEQRAWGSVYDRVLGITNRTNKEALKENSNKNDKLISTGRDLIAGEVSKDIVRKSMFSTEAIQAHDEGIIHIHDMDYDIQRMFNCCLVNLEDMLMNGTVINGKMIESPKSFRTACTVATQIVQQVSNSQYGGQTISLTHLAPFVRRSYDKHYEKQIKRLSESLPDIDSYTYQIQMEAERFALEDLKKEIKDGVQTIQYQINTFSSTNGQAPFLSLYIDLEENEEYSEEVAMVAEEIFKQRIQGIKNEVGVWTTPAFPKLLYVLRESNIDEDGKWYDLTKLAHECTAKRMNPDYISAKIMKQNYGDVFPCMGCRSFLAPYKDGTKWYGRFNQGVCTINLVDVAMSSKGIEDFYNILDERMDLVKEVLMAKHRKLLGTKASASPIHWQHGAIARIKHDDVIDPFLYDGYSTISVGYIGLAETVLRLCGENITEDGGKLLARDVLEHMESRVQDYKSETNIGFSLYGTPAESTAGRFAKKLAERFPETVGVNDKGYITNSHHVPVDLPIMPFDKLRIESEFQNIALGGSISYVEATNLKYNLDVMDDLTKFMYENIQYAEVNGKSDYCFTCGFDGEILIDTETNSWFCPECGNDDLDEMSVVRRTCGYLADNYWSEGRTIEIANRYVHIDNKEL